MIDMEGLTADERLTVEDELATRLRAEDGTFGSTTLDALIQSRLVNAKTTMGRDNDRIYGVLIEWPGYGQPQFLPVSEALWRAVNTSVTAPPTSIAEG